MYNFVKRILDLIIAIASLVILSPVLIVSIIILSVTGEREIFYLQTRVGYKQKEFKIWKFATMMKNSEKIGNKDMTLRNDPRVTPFGKFLRISKINELPQIFNVQYSIFNLSSTKQSDIRKYSMFNIPSIGLGEPARLTSLPDSQTYSKKSSPQ